MKKPYMIAVIIVCLIALREYTMNNMVLAIIAQGAALILLIKGGVAKPENDTDRKHGKSRL